MKKLFFLAAVAALALGFHANAQLQVLPSGGARIRMPTDPDEQTE